MSDNPQVPEHEHDTDTLASFANIVSKLDSVADKLESLIGYGSRTRALTKIMAFVIVLIVAFGSFSFYQIHQSQIDACHQRNATRADEVLLWKGVIQLSDKGKKVTVAQRKQEDQFIKFVEKTFPQADCEANYSLNPFNIGGGLAGGGN